MNKIDKDDDEVDDEGNPITQVCPPPHPPLKGTVVQLLKGQLYNCLIC
jgi:hypothetical protein